MRFSQSFRNKTGLLLLLSCAGFAGYAQDAAAPAKAVTSSTNQAAILMLVIAMVLAFVIWALGQVLFTMGRQALEKSKSQKAASMIMLLGLSLAGLSVQAQDAAAASGAVNVLPNYGGMSGTSFWTFFSVIMLEMIVIFFMMFSIRRIQRELLPEEEKKETTFARWWENLDKKLFTKAVPVEREADVLLDHDYDGIRELDNALPPWWKYGFYITIGVGVFYLFHYHITGYGMNPTQEYESEMARAQVKMELYASKQADKVDEKNIKMPGAEGLAKGKDLYGTNCWACHGKLGEGGAGPNLTDDYWIHKGSLNDIYHSIKVGYPDKGMQSWEKNFSPIEISYITGYIKTLKGTNPPNAKAPQGDLYTEAAAAPADSAAATVKPGAEASGVNTAATARTDSTGKAAK